MYVIQLFNSNSVNGNEKKRNFQTKEFLKIEIKSMFQKKKN